MTSFSPDHLVSELIESIKEMVAMGSYANRGFRCYLRDHQSRSIAFNLFVWMVFDLLSLMPLEIFGTLEFKIVSAFMKTRF